MNRARQRQRNVMPPHVLCAQCGGNIFLGLSMYRSVVTTAGEVFYHTGKNQDCLLAAGLSLIQSKYQK